MNANVDSVDTDTKMDIVMTTKAEHKTALAGLVVFDSLKNDEIETNKNGTLMPNSMNGNHNIFQTTSRCLPLAELRKIFAQAKQVFKMAPLSSPSPLAPLQPDPSSRNRDTLTVAIFGQFTKTNLASEIIGGKITFMCLDESYGLGQHRTGSNGCQRGRRILREIHYSTDEKGCRKDLVPIVPMVSTFEYIADTGLKYHVGRKQLPLLPAYAYTDYKAQGKCLQRVIVGLNGAGSLQSLYVVISRGTSLNARSTFRSTTLYGRFGQDVRDELQD
ncbi:hypothetical protein B0H13DRAFT_1886598 [Mycena leptocephala]|nr:hypothetical protein B0H13DRAFT_1886598 [Mycena leptocephala]